MTAAGDAGNGWIADFARACSTGILRHIEVHEFVHNGAAFINISASATDPWTGREVPLRLNWQPDPRGRPTQRLSVGPRSAPARHLMRHLPYLVTGLTKGAADEAPDWFSALLTLEEEADRVCRSWESAGGERAAMVRTLNNVAAAAKSFPPPRTATS